MQNVIELREAIESDRALRALRNEVAARAGTRPDAGHDLAHCERVALWTLRLAADSQFAVDPREAIAAALLHDVVNVPKDSAERAHASSISAEVARELLRSVWFEDPATERVCNAIRDHSFSRGASPEGPLGKALQDADRLEALGAIGIMRTFSCGALMGAQFIHPEDPWAEQRELNDRQYTVDHFFAKLLRLPATLHTEMGRQEARRRAEVMQRFLSDLATELGVPPVSAAYVPSSLDKKTS